MRVMPDVQPIELTGPPMVQFQNRFVTLTETPVCFPNGDAGTYVFVRSSEGFGGIIIPRFVRRGYVYYGLVVQHRVVIGQVTFEFPRGGSAGLGHEDAARELAEETGVEVDSLRANRLGLIYPDTGLLTTQVAVWIMTTTAEEDHAHVEAKTGARHVWVHEDELQGMIANGTIKCGMSIAAWGLLVATGQNRLPV